MEGTCEQNENRKTPKQILHYKPRGTNIRHPVKRWAKNIRL
jgi:hypothetical protein